MDGVPVVAAGRLPSMLPRPPVVLGRERVADLAYQAGSAFTLPPDPQRLQGP
jgi:hypothetical protein